MKLKDNFAAVYSNWLPHLAELEVPEERWADCANCHVCLNKKSKQFHTKCCDYHPCLPNHVVGQILSDKSEELSKGREILENKIKNKIGVGPLGIYPTLSYQDKFIRSRLQSEFTKQEEITELRCPYYLNGGCTIHKYRTDVCGTSFCISVSLSSGKQFWKAAKQLNQFLDRQVALRIAKNMGFDIKEAPNTLQETLAASELKGEVEMKSDYWEWKEWEGREVAYYKRCYELFKALKPEEVIKDLGEPFQLKNEKVKSLYASFISNELPQFMLLDEVRWAKQSDLSQLNSIDLWLLRLFNGRNKTDDIMKKALSLNVGLSKTLKSLIKKKILIEV